MIYKNPFQIAPNLAKCAECNFRGKRKKHTAKNGFASFILLFSFDARRRVERSLPPHPHFLSSFFHFPRSLAHFYFILLESGDFFLEWSGRSSCCASSFFNTRTYIFGVCFSGSKNAAYFFPSLSSPLLLHHHRL